MRYFLFLFGFLTTNLYFSQVPTNCFEIESILVDGCDGSNEGKNEMVIFHNGSNPTNVNDLRIDGAGANGTFQDNVWPNVSNNFLGFCTDANATAKLATLNQAITQCGFLREPVGGIIPAGYRVLLITSTDFTAIPDYFTNLTDTLYVIFQCAGNTQGHFTNFGTSSNRSLRIVNTATSCTDEITYDRSLLTKVDGTEGAEDGGSVGFEWDGTPNYFNNGCQLPLLPSSATISGDNSICPNETNQLIANISGLYSTIIWSGGTGTFDNTNSETVVYTPGNNETGLVTLNLKAFDPCGNQKIDEDFSFTINSLGTLNLISTVPNPICIGDSTLLVVSGGTTYTWSTNETNDSIVVFPVVNETISVESTINSCLVSTTIDLVVQTCNVPVVPIPDTTKIEIIFPNIFTPNGDLSNDFYTPISFSGVKNVNFSILNRWGAIMYETNTQDIKWDGKIDGKEVSEGVYFYKIIYFEGISTEEKVKHGFLHLERK
jgi:gliding motility-associated-like protein